MVSAALFLHSVFKNALFAADKYKIVATNRKPNFKSFLQTECFSCYFFHTRNLLKKGLSPTSKVLSVLLMHDLFFRVYASIQKADLKANLYLSNVSDTALLSKFCPF